MDGISVTGEELLEWLDGYSVEVVMAVVLEAAACGDPHYPELRAYGTRRVLAHLERLAGLE